jgi:hypothetical protein
MRTSGSSDTQAGEALLSRTEEFIMASLSNGSADPVVLAQLEQDYEDLAVKAAGLEAALKSLPVAVSAVPNPAAPGAVAGTDPTDQVAHRQPAQVPVADRHGRGEVSGPGGVRPFPSAARVRPHGT